jgi:ABC-type Na+ efflux pump permease subunit
LLTGKITLRLLFGAAQVILALLVVAVALDLKFNIFDFQTMFNISQDALNYYVVLLLTFGLIFLIGGLFLVYDWWESR